MEGKKLVAFLCVVTVGLLVLLPLTVHADVAGSTTLAKTQQPTEGAEESRTMFRRRLSDDDDDDDDDDLDCEDDDDHKPPKPSPSPPPPPPPPKKEKKKLTCLEKYRLRSDKCNFKHEWCKRECEDEDEKAICNVADDSCERKAYMLYKKCKYGKWTCKDWCAYNKMRCMEDDRLSSTTCKKRADYCYEKCDPKPIQKDEKHDDDDDHHHHGDDDDDN